MGRFIAVSKQGNQVQDKGARCYMWPKTSGCGLALKGGAVCRKFTSPLPLRFRAQLALQVAQGMSYLHQCNIVHFEYALPALHARQLHTKRHSACMIVQACLEAQQL